MLDEFRVSVTISAPLNIVWRELVTWQRQGEWMALTKVTASDHGADDSGLGTTIEAFTGIGRFGILDKMRVTKWDPPQFCQVEHYGKLIKGIGEFRLVPLDDKTTRFDWYEQIIAPKLILASIKPGILIAVFFSLRKFAASLRRR